MSIHTEHPFAGAENDPVRRLRGRVGGTVSLWTAGSADRRAGLTVTSLLVATGEPARVIGLLDPDADLTETLLAQGRGVVQLLTWDDRDLAEMFAGTAPAPGGAFRHASFEQTTWGPRLASTTTWVGLRVEDDRPLGWAREVAGVVEHVEVGEDAVPLHHRRGRYAR